MNGSESPAPTGDTLNTIFTALGVAGLASIGAGAIHAAAVGAHSEHQEVVVVFTVLAVIQLAWGVGAMALGRTKPWYLAVGAAVSGAALVGWLLAKTTGIGFIEGMEEAEVIQLADASAALLALMAGLIAAHQLFFPPSAEPGTRPSLLSAAILPIAVLTVTAMISAGSHSHAGGHDEGDDHPHEGDDHPHEGDDHPHEALVEVGPFVADDPVDLSGVPGVSDKEQEEAEDLLRRTLDKLPQFADVETLNSKGFYSIGDGAAGAEHYINWTNVNDDKLLNPDAPESLVIRHDGGVPRLAAAMYMLPEGSTFEDVPNVGGKLVQWHVHNNLCLNDDPVAPRLAGLASPDADCLPPNSKRGNVPMVHVWLEDHPCGPFAALEGIAGGQVPEGEEVVCTAEHAHATGG